MTEPKTLEAAWAELFAALDAMSPDCVALLEAPCGHWKMAHGHGWGWVASDNDPAAHTVEPDPPSCTMCPRCRAFDDPDHPNESGPFVDNLGDGEHVCCTRCGLCWCPFGKHEWPCDVCCAGTDDAQYVVNAALARDIQRLRKESASFEARWREAGDRAMKECGRRQALEAERSKD